MARWDDLDEIEDDFWDDESEGAEPWEHSDKEKLIQAVVIAHFRQPKTPLVRLLRDAQSQVFKNEPQKIRDIAKAPPWLTKRIRNETSPTEVMFLLVDSLIKQLESQGQTLELVFEALDAQADRIETLETVVRDGLAGLEEQMRRVRDRLNIEPPSSKSPADSTPKPIIVVVGLYPNQVSQVLDHCKKQKVATGRAEIVPQPKDNWNLPETCHYVILSQWAGQGWDEIIRKKNKTQDPSLPRTSVVHETKGLPMIAMRIGECINKYYNPQPIKP